MRWAHSCTLEGFATSSSRDGVIDFERVMGYKIVYPSSRYVTSKACA